MGKIKEASFPTNELKGSGRSQTERERTASEHRIAQREDAVKAGLKRRYNKSLLTPEQRRSIKAHSKQLDAINAMARKYGREIILANSIKGMKIGGKTVDMDVNGLYDATTGRIYIGVDAQDETFLFSAKEPPLR